MELTSRAAGVTVREREIRRHQHERKDFFLSKEGNEIAINKTQARCLFQVARDRDILCVSNKSRMTAIHSAERVGRRADCIDTEAMLCKTS